MRKQFDIIVYPVKEIEPPIEDPALEWFPSLNVNKRFLIPQQSDYHYTS